MEQLNLETALDALQDEKYDLYIPLSRNARVFFVREPKKRARVDLRVQNDGSLLKLSMLACSGYSPLQSLEKLWNGVEYEGLKAEGLEATVLSSRVKQERIEYLTRETETFDEAAASAYLFHVKDAAKQDVKTVAMVYEKFYEMSQLPDHCDEFKAQKTAATLVRFLSFGLVTRVCQYSMRSHAEKYVAWSALEKGAYDYCLQLRGDADFLLTGGNKKLASGIWFSADFYCELSTEARYAARRMRRLFSDSVQMFGRFGILPKVKSVEDTKDLIIGRVLGV